MKNKVALELFLLSAVSLYIELLIIRWVSADIRAFTVFRTFPLITCFVGLGVGFAVGKDENYKYIPLATLFMAIFLKAADFLGIGTWGFPSLGVFQWNNLVGLMQATNLAYLVLFMLIIILLLALPFGICVCIGARLGVLFSELKPLAAYSLNVAGAIAGSIVFPILSNLGLSPWQLLLLPAFYVVVDLFLKDKKLKLTYVLPFVLIPLIYIYVPSQHGKPLIPVLNSYQIGETKTLWSPYQRIDLSVFGTAAKDGKTPEQFLGLELSANRAFYQYLFNIEPGTIIADTELIGSIRKDYQLPFSFNNVKDVLIVGAGTGQNVTAALRAGAQKVDAVEIDPVILDIGRKYNPDYASDKVNLICDDARHFMSQTQNRYDVINFSTLDSHTVAGLGSSVRVDAYVYTKESIATALRLLKDNGLMQISFVTFAPWMERRLFETFREAAGYDPLVVQGKMAGTIYLLGPPVKNGTLKAPEGYDLVKHDNAPVDVRKLSDDWPYLYVQPNLLDWPYFLVLAEMILISMYAARKFLFAKNDSSSWQMFFLGSAFMLLELHAISFLSLLYGSTWVTSALVINGILVMILVANAFVNKFTAALTRNRPAVYILLLLAITISYFLPAESLLEAARSNQFAIYSLVTFLTILPMGIAAIIFATSFACVPNVSKALAFNLFGAVVGGLLEYLSNYWGIKSLNLVAVGLYAASAICCFSKSKIVEAKED